MDKTNGKGKNSFKNYAIGKNLVNFLHCKKLRKAYFRLEFQRSTQKGAFSIKANLACNVSTGKKVHFE